MEYDLLALDVDGTLVGPDNVVTENTVRAVAAARAAGLRVCLATGRSYAETMPIWNQLRLDPPYEPMVLVGGALVSEPDTGRTLTHQPMERQAACDFADALNEAGYCAMALVDSWRHGVDYYLTTAGDLHKAGTDWFSKMDVTVRRVARLADAADLPDVLRVSAVANEDDAGRLADALRERFDDTLNIQDILAPNYYVTIVEAHAAAADKHNAVRYVAQAHRIPVARVVAVGDDINDLALLRGAGLGVAVADSPRTLQAAADVVTPSLPEFISDLLAGKHPRDKP